MGLNIKKLQIDALNKNHHNIIILGKRATGKTTLIKHILEKSNNASYGYLFQIYCERWGDLTYEYDKQDNLEKHVVIDDSISQYFPLIQRVIEEKNNKTRNLIFDDVIYKNNIFSNKTFLELLMNNKQLNINNIFALSYLHRVNINNIDYIFILRENNESNRKRIFDSFGKFFNSFEEFNNILDYYWNLNKYNCLVIKCNSDSDKVEDCVFWYNSME